jgi:hypothetical protein
MPIYSLGVPEAVVGRFQVGWGQASDEIDGGLARFDDELKDDI